LYIIKPSDLGFDYCQQCGQTIVQRAPNVFLGNGVVVMPVDIADPHDRTPWQFRMTVTQFRWKPSRGLGNNLKGARHRIEEEPVVSEPFEGKARNETLRKFPVVADVV
jgi:hypothetical protein